MEIKQKMQDALNKQINAELYSAYIYLSMAAYAEENNLKGMGHWLKIQAKEETGHAMKLFGFVNERGGRVTLAAIEAPPTKWDSPLKMFEEVLAHEKKVTALIDALVDTAVSEKDKATQVFLNWFVDEQVEEEANATEIVEKLKMIKDSTQGLLLLDAELGKRKG